jgi:hypothetical protein
MAVVVVSGSNNDLRFAVTDVPPSGAPSTTFVTPGFSELGGPLPVSNGCVVACSRRFVDGDVSGSLVAVGQYGGGNVAIYDVSNAAAPTQLSMFDTSLGAPLTGIGALSLYGTNLLVGERSGSHIVLIDITNPRSPTIVSSIGDYDFGDGGIYSIVLNGSLAVVSGSFNVAVLDYTDAAHPKVGVAYPPELSKFEFVGPVVCDFDGASVAVGDASGKVCVFGIGSGLGLTLVGQSSAAVEGVSSIAVETGLVTQVAAGNFGSSAVTLFTFGAGTPPPTSIVEVSNGKGDAGGALAFYGLGNLFASTNNGHGVTWFNTTSWPSWSKSGPPVIRVAKHATLKPASVSTLGIAGFPDPVFKRLPFPWPIRP